MIEEDVLLLFLMPLFYYTPNVVLAAIIISAVIGLIDYQAAYKLWKVDKLDFLACMCSFFGVLFISWIVVQILLPENYATLSSRIMLNRSVSFGSWYQFCLV